ncbi:DNA cytosine methyltransferase [Microbacterium sp. IEGM 1404]|uniref:DNA cytosine methyltransferase n=1 Tax=Microbacterium sp. IEGM 1404 TaxID=3047084 RepID=UPI0024B83268|nr:DNA cytosine methyltransferase [Microbacterium sp. IEGM 1404]MDI9889944.1 DNA cytosine methyltransferase [Microbacterium sp. IEGM 1404]
MTPSLLMLEPAETVALDHFAGSGWSVACHWLGVLEYGVEKMHEAIRTRTRAGFRTIYRDVWSGLLAPGLVPPHRLYIASPPCQTFSIAGRGAGRKALDQVLALIASEVWKDAAKLLAAGESLGDDRTVLVLTPLAHIWAHRPELVALEQVPTVLPVWEAVGEVLRRLGYSVWVGNMQAEQYGVPQTRKRAILMARLDGITARAPEPTHSRYYSRTPERLDAGVAKWVSMAEALGWLPTDRVGFPRLADGQQTIEIDGVAYRDRDLRPADRPAQVVTEKARSWSRFAEGAEPARVTAAEAAALQSYPAWGHGAGFAAVKTARTRPRPIEEPAATVTSSATFSWEYKTGERRTAEPDELATLQSYPAWAFERPATTVAGDPRIWPPGHKVNADDVRRLGDAARAKYGDRKGTGAYRASVSEASTLQTYPSSFPFQGSRGKQFLQIGNAVPPLLALAIIGELLRRPEAPAPARERAVTAPVADWDQVFAEVTA